MARSPSLEEGVESPRQTPTAHRQRPTEADRPTDRQTDRVSTDRQRSTGSTRSHCQDPPWRVTSFIKNMSVGAPSGGMVTKPGASQVRRKRNIPSPRVASWARLHACHFCVTITCTNLATFWYSCIAVRRVRAPGAASLFRSRYSTSRVVVCMIANGSSNQPCNQACKVTI